MSAAWPKEVCPISAGYGRQMAASYACSASRASRKKQQKKVGRKDRFRFQFQGVVSENLKLKMILRRMKIC